MRLGEDDRRRTINAVAAASSTPADKERAAYLADTADDILDRITNKDHATAVMILALCFDQFGAQVTPAHRLKTAQEDKDE